MREKTECPICRSKKLSLLKTIEGIHILECKKCDLGISSKTKRVELYGKKSLYNLEAYQESQTRQIKKFQYIVRIINRLGVSSILEIGGGYGLFSKILSKSKKVRIEMVEPNLYPHYAKSARNIKHYKDSFDHFSSKTKRRYDLVVFLDVFEHLLNPRRVLKKVQGLLNTNGYILILLPNYKSLMAKICKHWSWWMIEDHKYHFSPNSMQRLLIGENFKLEYIGTYEDYYDFKKNLDGNFTSIRNPLVRKVKKGVYFSLFLPIYFAFRKIVWKFLYGGLLIVVAKK